MHVTAGADRTYGGYAKDGFDGASKAADHVLGEQMERLKKLVDGESAPRGR